MDRWIILGAASGVMVLFLLSMSRKNRAQLQHQDRQFVLAWRDFLHQYQFSDGCSATLRADIDLIATILPSIWPGIAEPHAQTNAILLDLSQRYGLALTDDPRKQVFHLIGLATYLIHNPTAPNYQQYALQCG